jgi:hypothetical protein
MTRAGSPTFAWVVNFSGGIVFGNDKTTINYVRAVHGGL